MRKNRLKVIQAAIVFFTTVFFAYNDIQAQDGLTPVPDGKQGFIYSPAAAPENNSDPSLAKPVGIGSFAAGGDILSIQISLNQFAGSVDVYGAYKISTDPDHVNILMPGSISFAAFTLSEIAAALSSGMPPAGAHPWKANTSGPINESLFDLPVSNIPQGAYSVYLLVTPAGNLESYYLWETFFQVSHEGKVSISGNLTFDFVPAAHSGGLNYSNTIMMPVRGAAVEAINASDSSILDFTESDGSGNYTVTVPVDTNVKIRLKAQLLKTGVPSWDFQVVDNTNGKSLYAADSGIFNSGAENITDKNLHASSGWGGVSYTSARSAAPFAILDVLYQALDKITAADPAVTLPPLLINWSINNIAVSGDKSLGQITTSHYDGAEQQLYILGEENNDTDEYDDHVIAHEWGHYFEYRLSRSDSMGGMHVIGDRLDPRIAFSEGFGNAVSGMITGDPYYIDTYGVSQASTGLFIDLEDNNFAESSEGWFSEASVWAILYDLYDSNDPAALGFTPIYDALVDRQKNASSFTTIFSFISFLKENNPGMIAEINSLVTGENISTAFIDEWDSTGTEANNGGSAKALPVYTRLTPDSLPAELCGNGFYGNYNKLMNRRFFYFQIHSSGNYTITAVPDFNGDPVMRLYSKGNLIASADNGGNGVAEILGISLSPGYYAGEIYEYGHVNNTYQTEECFEVTLN